MARSFRRVCGFFGAVLVLLVVTSTSAGPTKLPQDFKTCKKGAPDFVACVDDAIVDALQRMDKGLPDFGIPPLDPMIIPGLEIGDGNTNSPVNLHIKFSNIIIRNVKNAKPHNSVYDVDKYYMETHGELDKMEAEGDYDMDGRILLIPAKGKGRSIFKLTNLKASIVLSGEKEVKKGKEYFKLTNFNFTVISIEKLNMHFENLFNGDKTLGTNINSLLNENWQELWLQLKPALEELFTHQFKELSRRIFDKVPKDDIFLN